MIVEPGVVWSEADCARFARWLEGLARAECRRDGSPLPDDLSARFWEMCVVGDRFRSTHAPTSASTSVASAMDCRPANVETMTTRDVAAVLGTTDRNVRDLVARGRLSAQMATGAGWVFDPADVAAYQQERAG